MSRATLVLLGLLILLLTCSTVHAQGCATTLEPHFGVYTSVARDGKTISTSVTTQGYANVFPGPGCNMNAATHHVGAENKLNNVDHCSYSANGCPTCYFSITANEETGGDPGTAVPFSDDREASSSLVG